MGLSPEGLSWEGAAALGSPPDGSLLLPPDAPPVIRATPTSVGRNAFRWVSKWALASSGAVVVRRGVHNWGWGELSCPLTSASPFAPGSSSGPPDQPRLVIEVHPSRTAVSQGSEVTLRCLVRGDPPHFFYWSREDGRPVPSAVQLRDQGESAPSPQLGRLQTGGWWSTGLGRPRRGGVPRVGRGTSTGRVVFLQPNESALGQGGSHEPGAVALKPSKGSSAHDSDRAEKGVGGKWHPIPWTKQLD